MKPTSLHAFPLDWPLVLLAFVAALLVSPPPVMAEKAVGVGDGERYACTTALNQAKNTCAKIGAGIGSDDLAECLSSCQWKSGKFECSLIYECAGEAETPVSYPLQATNTTRLPNDLNPCEAAVRKARQEIRNKCLDDAGALKDTTVGSCTCKPLLFLGEQPAGECTVTVKATCDTSDN